MARSKIDLCLPCVFYCITIRKIINHYLSRVTQNSSDGVGMKSLIMLNELTDCGNPVICRVSREFGNSYEISTAVGAMNAIIFEIPRIEKGETGRPNFSEIASLYYIVLRNCTEEVVFKNLNLNRKYWK